jgi:hypothetical protein
MDNLHDSRNPYAAPENLEASSAELSADEAAVEGGLKIHGWLIIPAAGLFIGPLVMTAGIINDLVELSQAWRGQVIIFGGSMVTYWVRTLIEISLVIFTLYVARQFFARRRTAPRWMIRLYLAGLLLAVVEGGWYASLHERYWPAAIQSVLRSGIVTAIWVPYFLKSKRVQRTFVR